MDKILLEAEKRDVTGKKVNAYRRLGKLPAVLYGYGIDPTSIFLDGHSAMLTLSRTSASSLVTIVLDGKEYPALVREKQRNYLQGTLLHVDFLSVSLTELIRAQVPVEFVGHAPAVKDYNAILVDGLTMIEIECLPTELPEKFEIDLSSLAEVGSGFYVKDLVVSDKISILSDPEEMIVVATAAREEEEEEAEELMEGEEVGAAEPEVIEKGKKEEEADE